MRGQSRLYVLLLISYITLYTTFKTSQAQPTCQEAIETHSWALDTLGACEDPATQNTPLCGIIGQYEASSGQGGGAGGTSPGAVDQLLIVANPAPTVDPWQNYLTQSAMSAVADLGEIAYVVNQVNGVYQTISTDNLTADDYYGTWQQAWWSQNVYNLNIAQDYQNGWDDRGRMLAFWKACTYIFAGSWPNAFSEEAIDLSFTAVEAFQAGATLDPRFNTTFFNVDFNNGTADAVLPGFFITPDVTQQLPLVIITGGTDYPKEINRFSFADEFLERRFAVLAYDGPGQGEVIKNPPFMPFYAEWEQVLSVILDYVETNLTDYVQPNSIVQMGLSLGGYLGGRACAGNGDRLQACILNPPQTSVAAAYNRFSEGLADGIYGPLQAVEQSDASLIPANYSDAIQNPVDIINTLLLGCDADSGAPELIAASFGQGLLDPELVYLAAGYGGVISGDPQVLAGGLWQGFQNLQAFGDYGVENITVPVIGIKGTEDDLLGGQEQEFFDRLSPDTQEQSSLIVFDAESGGALHDQVGSPFVLAAKTFAVLNSILQANVASPASAPGPSENPLPASGK